MLKRSILLFEPLPVARIGVRRDNDQVILGTDFSTFGYILEEFIGLGIQKIAIPKSFPEVSALSSAPQLLMRRISIIDDTCEIESVDRLLHPLMIQLGIKVDDNTGDLKKPKDLSQKLFSAFRQTRRDIKCMALGLNKSVQIDIDPNAAIASARVLRQVSHGPTSRIILANFEGFFSYYKEIEFNAVAPPTSVPATMISLFDELVNDSQYGEYSEAVAALSIPHRRSSALSKIRTLGRAMASSNVIARGWNFVAKSVNVWTGVPIPDSNTLSALVSDKSLPAIIDLQPARQRALTMWMSSADHELPYNRSGRPFPKEEVDWLPPLDSVSAQRPEATYLSLGTVGEIRERLQKFEKNRTTPR